MITKQLCSTSSFFSVRSALYADNASKYPFQHLVQNALGSARQIWRKLFQEKPVSPSTIIRPQHRLPVEFIKGHSGPAVASKFKFISYRPGIIQKVTSRWCTKSLTDSQRKYIIKRFYQGGSGPLFGFVGFALAKKPSLLTSDEELETVSCLMRDSFKSMEWKGCKLDISDTCLSKISLTDLKFGELLAKGCNAAIYSACLESNQKYVDSGKEAATEIDNQVKMQMNDSFTNSNFFRHAESNLDIITESNLNLNPCDRKNENENMLKEQNISSSHFFKLYSEDVQNCKLGKEKSKNDLNSLTEDFSPYNLAVKVMFNYEAESNAYAIFRSMYRETLPYYGEFSFGNTWNHKVKRKKLKPHPNIVEIYAAFADQLPLLPGALKNYPQALPTRLLTDGCGRNMTLFIVMKRYHCCLKEYLQLVSVTSEVALLLFTQLLEALVHLLQNSVAHRDLKTDNILIDLSLGIHSPRLAITDFGCCSESLSLSYTSNDIPKGGNMLLMAPEIVNSEPGPYSTIDYSRSDLWAAGTIAYEIFGGSNPFYSDSTLKSFSYHERDLPLLPTKAPPVINSLVKEILSVDPRKRPSPSFAASVCQVLLHTPFNSFTGVYDNNIREKVQKWMFEFSSQTYLEVLLCSSETLPLDLVMRHIFCRRMNYLELVHAIEYILKI